MRMQLTGQNHATPNKAINHQIYMHYYIKSVICQVCDCEMSKKGGFVLGNWSLV